jgi:DNA-binding beta-propeller fold protein YncE
MPTCAIPGWDCRQPSLHIEPVRLALALSGLAALVVTLAVGASGSTSGPPANRLVQPRGRGACVSEGGSDGCRAGRAMWRASAVATSPDGRNVYVGAEISGAVDVLSRDRKTGVLRQLAGRLGCVSKDGAEGCAVGRGLALSRPVLVSADSRFVYVGTGGGVAILRRSSSTGALSQLSGAQGCVLEPASSGCQPGRASMLVRGLALSPDGRNLYAASIGSSSVSVFRRDLESGALTQLAGGAGCIADAGRDRCSVGRGLGRARSVAVSDDGHNVYVVGLDGGVAVFARSRVGGSLAQLPGSRGCLDATAANGCAQARGIGDAHSIVVTHHGRNAYVASAAGDAVAVFSRSANDGALTELPGRLGCVQARGRQGCASGNALGLAHALVLGDADSVAYLAAPGSSSVDVFLRDRRTGALRQLPGPHGCYSEPASAGCAPGRGISGAHFVAVSPDGQNLYVAAELGSGVAMFSVIARP